MTKIDELLFIIIIILVLFPHTTGQDAMGTFQEVLAWKITTEF